MPPMPPMMAMTALAILIVMAAPGRRAGGGTRPPPAPPSVGGTPVYYCGQLSSMVVSASSSSAPPEIQATMPSQKVPAPTSGGIRSEPSKRNTSADEASSAICRVMSSEYWLLSNVECGDSQPPAAAQGPPNSSEVRNSITATVSSSSLNIACLLYTSDAADDLL